MRFLWADELIFSINLDVMKLHSDDAVASDKLVDWVQTMTHELRQG